MAARRYVLVHALAWALLMVAALVDGIARAVALAPALGEGPARALGGVVMTALTLLAAALARRAAAPPSAVWAIVAGLVWTAGTIGFEALVTVASGRMLSTLWQTYDPRRIVDGELILVGLAAMAIAPLGAHLLARRKAQLGGAP